LITGNPPPKKKSKKNEGHFARVVFCQLKSFFELKYVEAMKPLDKNKSNLASLKKTLKLRDILLMLQFFFHQQYDIEIKLGVFGGLCPYVTCFRSHHLEDKDVGKWQE